MSDQTLTTQERLRVGLGGMAIELEELRKLALEVPNASMLARELAEKEAELVELHEELDDLRSELAGHNNVEHDLEAKIERLEGELDSLRMQDRADRDEVFAAADDLCRLVLRALGAEKVTEDSLLVYQLYRAVETVRDANRAAEAISAVLAEAKLKTWKHECGAESFVEQLQNKGV